jgi:hypothetical protein
MTYSVHPCSYYPVKVDGVSYGKLYIGEGQKLIGSVQFRSEPGGYPHLETEAEMLAVAALWMAAPEMLAALESALDSLEYVHAAFPGKSGYGVRANRINDAREAIALAKTLPERVTA